MQLGVVVVGWRSLGEIFGEAQVCGTWGVRGLAGLIAIP